MMLLANDNGKWQDFTQSSAYQINNYISFQKEI